MNTKLRCVGLTKREFDYLNTAELLSPALLEFLRGVRWRTDSAGTLEISAATAEEFRDAFTVQLAKVGFDESYEPTEEGRLLEVLIDRFCESL